MSKILEAVRQTREDMTLKNNNNGTISIVAPCSFEKPKPLSDEEIVNIWEIANYESKYYEASNNFAIEFARAIEERHGIK